jgi:hypothetical protein
VFQVRASHRCFVLSLANQGDSVTSKMHKLHVVLWVLLAASGCAKDEAAVRPAQDPGAVPQSDAGAPAPDVVVSPPPTAPAASAEPRDPLLSKPVDCGAARPNPHGIALEWMTRRDGSCMVCEREPAPLKACAPGQRSAAISAKALGAQRGKRVNVPGTLGVTNAMCTKRGGPCACNNGCSSLLKLSQAEPETPVFGLTSQGEPLGCPGDEGGLCCPYALGEGKRSVEVVVSGTLAQQKAAEPGYETDLELTIEVESICAR